MKSQESKSSNFNNIQSPFCVDQLIIAVGSLVLHNIWRSDQSDSTPDIPGKILLPGPRKWTKVTTLSRSRREVWSGDETRLDYTTLLAGRRLFNKGRDMQSF